MRYEKTPNTATSFLGRMAEDYKRAKAEEEYYYNEAKSMDINDLINEYKDKVYVTGEQRRQYRKVLTERGIDPNSINFYSNIFRVECEGMISYYFLGTSPDTQGSIILDDESSDRLHYKIKLVISRIDTSKEGSVTLHVSDAAADKEYLEHQCDYYKLKLNNKGNGCYELSGKNDILFHGFLLDFIKSGNLNLIKSYNIDGAVVQMDDQFPVVWYNEPRKGYY